MSFLLLKCEYENCFFLSKSFRFSFMSLYCMDFAFLSTVIKISYVFLLFNSNIVTRNNIVWKFARGYCLCYSKIFSLVPGSTKCTFLSKSAVHYLYHLKSNNIIGLRKTANTEKFIHD